MHLPAKILVPIVIIVPSVVGFFVYLLSIFLARRFYGYRRDVKPGDLEWHSVPIKKFVVRKGRTVPASRRSRRSQAPSIAATEKSVPSLRWGSTPTRGPFSEKSPWGTPRTPLKVPISQYCTVETPSPEQKSDRKTTGLLISGDLEESNGKLTLTQARPVSVHTSNGSKRIYKTSSRAVSQLPSLPLTLGPESGFYLKTSNSKKLTPSIAERRARKKGLTPSEKSLSLNSATSASRTAYASPTSFITFKTTSSHKKSMRSSKSSRHAKSERSRRKSHRTSPVAESPPPLPSPTYTDRIVNATNFIRPGLPPRHISNLTVPHRVRRPEAEQQRVAHTTSLPPFRLTRSFLDKSLPPSPDASTTTHSRSSLRRSRSSVTVNSSRKSRSSSLGRRLPHLSFSSFGSFGSEVLNMRASRSPSPRRMTHKKSDSNDLLPIQHPPPLPQIPSQFKEPSPRSSEITNQSASDLSHLSSAYTTKSVHAVPIISARSRPVLNRRPTHPPRDTTKSAPSTPTQADTIRTATTTQSRKNRPAPSHRKSSERLARNRHSSTTSSSPKRKAHTVYEVFPSPERQRLSSIRSGHQMM